MRIGRATGKAHHLDEMEFRKSGKWGEAMFDDDFAEQDALAMRQKSMYVVRLRDEKLRELMRNFETWHATTASSRNRDEAKAAMAKMMDAFEKIQERIGELLRTIDDEESFAVRKV